MKMIYAGPASSPNAVAENWLYNCIRNVACQKPYFIPIVDFSDFIMYFDFPGKPTIYQIFIIPCTGAPIDISALFCNYVIAQKPDNSWYGIFTNIIDTDFPALTEFYISATFTVNGTDYKYFSNQFRFDICDQITKIESCYNDPSNGASAYDCNGIYYGFHSGTDIPIGNIGLRYFHHVYVRDAEVIETSNKMTFTLFNSQIAYKNYFNRLYNFTFELVPTFYKDVLIGVLNRGTIGINGQTYTLAEAQEFNITNESLKWWSMIVKLSSLCRQWFSCNPTTCIPAVPLCVNDFENAEFIDDHIHLSGGVLNEGDSIGWFLSIGDTVIESGTSTDIDIYPYLPLDTDNNCYTFQWYKNCACGGSSEENNTSFFFRYGFSNIPFGDGTGGTIDLRTFDYQYSGVILNGQPLITQFVEMPINQFIAVQYPDTESSKVNWVNTVANYGVIPDFVMDDIITMGNKKYITSRIEMTLDNAFTTIFS